MKRLNPYHTLGQNMWRGSRWGWLGQNMWRSGVLNLRWSGSRTGKYLTWNSHVTDLSSNTRNGEITRWGKICEEVESFNISHVLWNQKSGHQPMAGRHYSMKGWGKICEEVESFNINLVWPCPTPNRVGLWPLSLSKSDTSKKWSSTNGRAPLFSSSCGVLNPNQTSNATSFFPIC